LEIAEEFGLSRHKVARSLLKARESSVVRISINFTLTQHGVVAEVCTTLIDTDGQVVSTPLTSQLISIDAQQLGLVPNIVAVADGPSKRRAIAAALASGLIDSLVTDVSTAHHLLAAIDTDNRATGHHLKSPSMANPKEEELT
jgi:DNA-binding transcriptional regulator LsrR (DeoR family)